MPLFLLSKVHTYSTISQAKRQVYQFLFLWQIPNDLFFISPCLYKRNSLVFLVYFWVFQKKATQVLARGSKISLRIKARRRTHYWPITGKPASAISQSDSKQKRAKYIRFEVSLWQVFFCSGVRSVKSSVLLVVFEILFRCLSAPESSPKEQQLWRSLREALPGIFLRLFLRKFVSKVKSKVSKSRRLFA